MSAESVIASIRLAFDGVARPSNADLLHPDCRDDGDLESLYGVGHWHEIADADTAPDYAALHFLSPPGFCHFLPGYMEWSLRHPRDPSIVHDTIAFVLDPDNAGPGLADFVSSKWSTFDRAQRQAVAAYLTHRAGVDPDSVPAALVERWADPRAPDRPNES